ncbi:hypothetical protein PAXRUDRAFT_629728 [Paxillus rubicundulus Ve08.2h10]|uniref:Mid2 domain-containing protein n=1 Tax=Paxillus rubicundulus Ve08.2h10 TaxID=930991 RepID=A0A0D0E3B8_9AGAM|nr:hypothetical protein PAXRUDRAFT_629728 [Paxillus rubicundulus Ve08.2h10]
MAKLGFALILCLTLFLALVVDALESHRRDHANLNRVIKKRAPAPQGGLGGVFGPASQPTSAAVQPTQITPTAVQTTPANSIPNAAPASPSASPSSTGSGLLGSIVGGVLPTSLSPTNSASTSSSTTFSSTSSHSSSTPAPPTSTQPDSIPTQQSESIYYLTSSVAPSPTQTSSTSSSSGMSHAAMTILIVIAASVGAAIIIWTIIRKWKFRPSSDFEGRMQPIDWQPGSDVDTGFSGQRHRMSNASSFHSGSSHGHGDDQFRGQAGGHSAAALSPIPDHDFTAGAAHLATVGGYADLARGPSPQPTMQEALGLAPSINRPHQHDQYGVPLHHGYSGY